MSARLFAVDLTPDALLALLVVERTAAHLNRNTATADLDPAALAELLDAGLVAPVEEVRLTPAGRRALKEGTKP